MNKKILVLLNKSFRNDSRVIKQMRSLSINGYDVTLFCATSNEIIYEFENIRVREKSAFLKKPKQHAQYTFNASERFFLKTWIIKKLKKKLGIFLQCLDFANLIHRSKEINFSDFSLIHAHDVDTLLGAYYLHLQYRCPFIYDSHEIHQGCPNIGPIEKWIIARIEKHALAKCSRLITVSEEAYSIISEQYNHTLAPLIIYNSPVMNVTINHSLRIKESLGLDSTNHLVIYVGHLTPARASHEILKAISICSDVHFAIVGMNPKNYDDILNLAQTYGIKHRLHLIEHQAPENLIHFISDADASLVLFHANCVNHIYTRASKMFECAFAKLPMIYCKQLVATASFMSEFNIGHGIENCDPETIATGIQEVIAHKEQYQINNACYQQIYERYSWEVQEKNLVQAYRKILEAV